LVQLAIEKNTRLKLSSIEFSLPKPSYTIDTLTYLKEKYPGKEFCLIMGGDNLVNIEKWKNYEQLLQGHDIYLYQRSGYENIDPSHTSRVTFLEAPILDISSTMI